MIDRRTFLGTLTLLAATRAWPQASRPIRIGWLSNDAPNSPFFDAFREGMRNLGYVEGSNLVIEARFAAGSPEQMEKMAAELASMGMELLAMPFLIQPHGFYTPEQARAAWLEHLEDVR